MTGETAMSRIVLVDNYDSFTYNIYQQLSELGARVEVIRNDRVTVEALAASGPDGVIVSPGPGRPENAGISMPLVSALRGRIPLLGVCLGHQAIVAALGGRIVRAARLMHGKTSPVHHDGSLLFRGVANPFEATRYHSLLAERESLPGELVVTAWTAEDEIMGVSHRSEPLFGVQFHPESILTREGPSILRNFLDSCRPRQGRKNGPSPGRRK